MLGWDTFDKLFTRCKKHILLDYCQNLYTAKPADFDVIQGIQECSIPQGAITIKTIEFGTLIYLSDRAVLLAFWRILNQGNRPNKTENT